MKKSLDPKRDRDSFRLWAGLLTLLVGHALRQTGELKLDKDGFPVGMNLWAGMDGQVYVRGNIYATDGVFNGTVYATGGEFKGIVKATDFQTPAGVSMLTKDGKFDSKYLDLGGIVIDGETGNINFTGAGSITWGNNAPVKYQFGGDLTGPWHDTMQANDKYRRDSLDGGTTWGEPYQFKGTDGKNGSNASVPQYIKQTYIDSVEIRSPTIKANDYYIYPFDEADLTGSFVIRGGIPSSQVQRDMFRIDYNGEELPPTTHMYAGAGATLDIGTGTGKVKITGNLDLSSANITDWGNNAPTAVFG